MNVGLRLTLGYLTFIFSKKKVDDNSHDKNNKVLVIFSDVQALVYEQGHCFFFFCYHPKKVFSILYLP